MVIWVIGLNEYLLYMTGKGIPIRHVLGKSKILLGLLEGIPTMLKGEVSMVFLEFPRLGSFSFMYVFGTRKEKFARRGNLEARNLQERQ